MGEVAGGLTPSGRRSAGSSRALAVSACPVKDPSPGRLSSMRAWVLGQPHPEGKGHLISGTTYLGRRQLE